MSDSQGVTALPEHTCWTLLRSAEVARLAVSVDNRPDIFPVNFVVDHGTVVVRTGEGSKFAAMMSNPVVAFEVDGEDAEAHQAWSVVINGRAEEIKQLHERIETMDLPLFPWHADPVSVFDDSVEGTYYDPAIPYASVITPGSGLRIEILKASANRSTYKVGVSWAD